MAQIPDWLEQRARALADHPAVVAERECLSWSELALRARGAAAWLRARGVRRGQAVALLLPNGAELVALLHGATRLGAVAAPLGTRLRPPELAAQLRACGARLLCVDESTAAAAAGLPAEVAVVPGPDQLRLAARSSPARSNGEARIDLDAPHTIVFTSGSTGQATGVVLSAGNHLWSGLGSAGALGVRPDDRWLVCLPCSHVGGLAILMRSLVFGTTAIVHDRFDPERVHHAIDHERVTMISVVAATLRRLLETRGGRRFPDSLRCVLAGGGPVPRALLEECVGRGVPVATTYGLTEAASQAATLAPAELPGRFGAAGRPLLGVELRIVGDGRPAAVGEVGEIQLRGPAVSRATVRDGRRRTRRGEWLATRDLGWLDADGVLTVTGRADDVIISGGENVHPREVEIALEAQPGIAEACVFGVPDPRWGQAVAAWVRPRNGTDVDTDTTIAALRAVLAGFKLPRRIEVVADFPRSPAGKILRREVQARAGGALLPFTTPVEPAAARPRRRFSRLH